MSDTIGAMRARVRLQRPVRVADEIGGAAVSWTNAGDVWAEISASGAGDNAAYDGAPTFASFRVVINRREVAAKWRVVWGERLLRVTGVRDDGGVRIELSCEEETF